MLAANWRPDQRRRPGNDERDMARPQDQIAGKEGTPAHLPHDPKQDERLEEEQRLQDVLEDDEVREALKRLHLIRPETGKGKPG